MDGLSPPVERLLKVDRKGRGVQLRQGENCGVELGSQLQRSNSCASQRSVRPPSAARRRLQARLVEATQLRSIGSADFEVEQHARQS
jgi:hypothetical protein